MRQGDADARGREQFAPGQPDRRAERGQHAATEFGRHLRPVQAFREDREFVATEPRDHVAGAHAADDAAGGLDQQFVADRVAGAVVDQLETVEVEEQHGEASLRVAARHRDRLAQAFQQLGAVGQAGQGIVGGLVGQLALGAHAFADLLDQFRIRLGEFAGALADPLFQPRMRVHQPILRLLAGQAAADVVGDEGQQFLVAGGERHVRRIALHGDHADHLVVVQQRHPQPAVRQGPDASDLAFRLQPADPRTVGQQRLAGPQHVFGQPVGDPARLAHLVAVVHRIRELQHAPVDGQHGDVEIACVEQAADDLVDLGIEALQRLAGHRQLGNAEQRALEFLRPLPLRHFRLQVDIGLLQLRRALLHALLELLARLVAIQRGEDVLGHVGQQRAILVAVDVGLLVVLHHDRADHAAAPAHRHAQPVGAVRPAGFAEGDAMELSQLRRRPPHRLAGAQQVHGQGVLVVGDRDFLGRIVDPGVDQVDEIQEAHRLQVLVVQHDVEIAGVHQLAHDRVDPAQHLLQLQAAAGEVGDLVQGLLQALRAVQGLDPLLRRVQQAGQFVAAQRLARGHATARLLRLIGAIRQWHDPDPVHSASILELRSAAPHPGNPVVPARPFPPA